MDDVEGKYFEELRNPSHKTVFIMRTLVLFFLIYSIATIAQSPESQAIEVFEKYKAAILHEEFEEAVMLIDSRTWGYYGDLLHHIHYSDSLTLDTIPALDKFWVLIFRHSIPKEKLLSYSTKDLIEQVLFQLGLASIYHTNISNLSKKGDTWITAELRQTPDQIPGELNFYLEDGSWKMDLRRMLAGSEEVIDQLVVATGLTENEAILQALESLNGIAPSSSVWRNLK